MALSLGESMTELWSYLPEPNKKLYFYFKIIFFSI